MPQFTSSSSLSLALVFLIASRYSADKASLSSSCLNTSLCLLRSSAAFLLASLASSSLLWASASSSLFLKWRKEREQKLVECPISVDEKLALFSFILIPKTDSENKTLIFFQFWLTETRLEMDFYIWIKLYQVLVSLAYVQSTQFYFVKNHFSILITFSAKKIS